VPKKHKQKNRKPSYYRKDYLTVGMLEDLCGGIKDKSLPIRIADAFGLAPEPVIAQFIILRKGKQSSLQLNAKFSWSGDMEDGVEGSDDIPFKEGEDTEEQDRVDAMRMAVRMALAGGAACSLPETLPKNEPLPKGLAYLGEPQSGQSSGTP
jgi:hypothetical protein